MKEFAIDFKLVLTNKTRAGRVQTQLSHKARGIFNKLRNKEKNHLGRVQIITPLCCWIAWHYMKSIMDPNDNTIDVTNNFDATKQWQD